MSIDDKVHKELVDSIYKGLTATVFDEEGVGRYDESKRAQATLNLQAISDYYMGKALQRSQFGGNSEIQKRFMSSDKASGGVRDVVIQKIAEKAYKQANGNQFKIVDLITNFV